jgi:hypothetical protein
MLPQATLAVRAEVAGHVKVAPERLWFGRVSANGVQRRPLQLTSRLSPDFQLLEVTSDLPAVSVETASQEQGATDMQVALDGSQAEPGLIRGNLRIRTDVPDQPVITVPVSAFVFTP